MGHRPARRPLRLAGGARPRGGLGRDPRAGGVATSEKTEGNKTAWAPLLEAELGKARQVQDELPALRKSREAEQAVIAVFLHSQPIGHRASTPELVRMAGSAAPDSIELEKGLRRWRDISWFLDDEDAPFGAGFRTRVRVSPTQSGKRTRSS